MMRSFWTRPSHLAAATLAAAVMMASPMTSRLAVAASPTSDVPGELVIFSTTDGADVEIDGKSVGKLPMDDSIMLLPGQHKIKVTMRGWTHYIDTFEIKAGEELELEIDLIPFAGIVRIDTREPGATVIVDGKVEGVTPFDKDVAVGKKVISVTRPGFHEEVRELEIEAGKSYDIDILLRALPEGSGAEGPEFYETWWFWTILAVAGGGAATAIALSSGGDERPPSANFTLQVP